MFCRDDDGIDPKSRADNGNGGGGNGGSGGGAGGTQTAGTLSSANSLLDSSQTIAAIEYKKGYVMRKCCYDANNKKSKSWFSVHSLSVQVLCRVCILWAAQVNNKQT